MIQSYATDLVTKLKSVAAFGGRVASTLGGTEADPTLTRIDVPAAWVLFQGSQNSDKSNQRWQMMRLNFSVLLLLQYGAGESDFVDTQLKLIEDATQAVRGTLASETGSHLWSFDGCSLVDVETNRISYQLNFSADAAYSNPIS